MKNPKGGMTGYRERRDLLDTSRFLVFMFFIYTIINAIGMKRFDIEGMHTFLISFNWTVLLGIMLILFLIDLFRHNILNYGRLRE